MTKPSSKGRRPADLDNNDLRPITEVERLQKDMLRLLQGVSVDPISYVGLEYCGPEHCGRIGCSEGCAFGTARRRKNDIPRIAQLLKQRGGPIHEVRVCRPYWSRPFEELDKVSIASGKDAVRRALDSLFDSTIIAVGTFKVTPIGADTGHWLCEIHVIVAGADEVNLERAFSAVRAGQGPDVRITKIEDLGAMVNEVTNCNLLQRPPKLGGAPPLAQRREFLGWLLNLKVDARLIRYGCDKYFNPLTKQRRTPKPKIRRKRPYPTWLIPYMFDRGARWWRGLPSEGNFKTKVKFNPVPPPPDYYDEGTAKPKKKGKSAAAPPDYYNEGTSKPKKKGKSAAAPPDYYDDDDE
jgi:hypothetical protein